jgi:hypothetical protein
MRIVVLIGVAAVLLLAVALLAMWLPLPRPFPPAESGERTTLAAVTTGVLGFAYLVGLGAYLIAWLRGPGQALDAALSSRGLATRSAWGLGRRYTGQVGARQVQVAFTPPSGLQRAFLTIHVSADSDVRLAVGPRRPLLDCRECARIDVAGRGLGDLQVYSGDERRVRRLLSDPSTQAVLARLLAEQARDGLRELYLQPSRLWLRARPTSRVTGARVGEWLDDLLALGQAVETVD